MHLFVRVCIVRSAHAGSTQCACWRQACSALQRLAIVALYTLHALQVTEDGDLIYSIPSNSRQAILLHSAELRAEAAARAAGATAVNVGKFVFAGANCSHSAAAICMRAFVMSRHSICLQLSACSIVLHHSTCLHKMSCIAYRHSHSC